MLSFEEKYIDFIVSDDKHFNTDMGSSLFLSQKIRALDLWSLATIGTQEYLCYLCEVQKFVKILLVGMWPLDSACA